MLISEKFNQYAVDPNQVYSVRIRLDDLATIVEFLVSNDIAPKSTGEVTSLAFKMFAESIINSGKAKRYNVQEAKCLIEGLGLRIPGQAKNRRTIGCQIEPIALQSDPLLATEIECISRQEVRKDDLAVPADVEGVLVGLEQGSAPLAKEE